MTSNFPVFHIVPDNLVAGDSLVFVDDDENLDIEMQKHIVEEGSYYLELTPEGQKEFYGIELPGEIQESSVPEIPLRRKTLRASS